MGCRKCGTRREKKAKKFRGGSPGGWKRPFSLASYSRRRTSYMKGTVLGIAEKVLRVAERSADDQQFHCGVRQRHEDPSKQLVYGEEPALVKLRRSAQRQSQRLQKIFTSSHPAEFKKVSSIHQHRWPSQPHRFRHAVWYFPIGLHRPSLRRAPADRSWTTEY